MYYVSVKTPKYTEWCSSSTQRASSCGRLKAVAKILCNSTQQKEKSICLHPLTLGRPVTFLWPTEWDRSVSLILRLQEALQKQHSCSLGTLLPCDQDWGSPREDERPGTERGSLSWGSLRPNSTSWVAKRFQRSVEPAKIRWPRQPTEWGEITNVCVLISFIVILICSRTNYSISLVRRKTNRQKQCNVVSVMGNGG